MKNTYADEPMIDMQQARAAAGRYKKHALPERAVVASEIVTAPDKRKKYLKAALTRERALATVTEAESHGAPPQCCRDTRESCA